MLSRAEIDKLRQLRHDNRSKNRSLYQHTITTNNLTSTGVSNEALSTYENTYEK